MVSGSKVIHTPLGLTFVAIPKGGEKMIRKHWMIPAVAHCECGSQLQS